MSETAAKTKQKQKSPTETNGRSTQNGGKPAVSSGKASAGFTKDEVLADYRIAHQSRLTSLLGRREVLTGKAKFGIFGDGKEVPQIAMAKAFKAGDWRSGYYRDQTFMMAAGLLTIEQFFAQLYAHTDVEAEPASAGRMMNGHFATRTLNDDGSFKKLAELKNSSADISPTGGQMPRLLGLAYASKLFREIPELALYSDLSHNGDEVAFGTIGNASTSEGLFFETINAGGVLRVPMVVSVWDDEYGISVHAKSQTCKESISDILSGFAADDQGRGYNLYQVPGWDYAALCEAYLSGVEDVRKSHIPAVYHITELTQPQGHSTSGSHERYKSKERLAWEEEHDCITRMRQWIIDQGFATGEEMNRIDEENKEIVSEAKFRAWEDFLKPILKDREAAASLIRSAAENTTAAAELEALVASLEAIREPIRRDVFVTVHKALRLLAGSNADALRLSQLADWRKAELGTNEGRYGSHLYSESSESAFTVPVVEAKYEGETQKVDGRQVLQACFDAALGRDPRVFAIGEDIGTIGDVNLAFENMQAKYGEWRVTDTGIREATIIGQAIGAAMRGLRPIAEIQYLDYLLYALQIMSDDLATVQYRTMGGQKAPVIVRTRGHRLEGIWHSGSPMGMIIGALRGMFVLVPRNMTQAAGFYNTMLKSDDTALIVEVLSGYRFKEVIPSNIGEFTLPVGVPEILREGSDITLVTYGASCRLAMEASVELEKSGISVELIDVQSLLPFDIHSSIVESVKKTNRVLFLDEDVPGGASAFMMQEVLEKQNGYRWLDSAPKTLTAREHRPAYGSDGDYFSKPTVEDIFDACYEIMAEADPGKYRSSIEE